MAKLQFFSTLRKVLKNFSNDFRHCFKCCIFELGMKPSKAFITTLALLLLSGLHSHAQEVLKYEIVEGDTVLVDNLAPARIYSFRKNAHNYRSLRKYYRTVYNFNAVYPYALVGRKMMAQVDSIVEAEHLGKADKTRYINQVERELFRLFEQDIRHMTISQGFVLVKLIDRECGRSAYEIIRSYESKLSADFWNLVGKLFSQNLKGKYDPEGEDAVLEELVQIWDEGAWVDFYNYIFGADPSVVVIKADSISVRPSR